MTTTLQRAHVTVQWIVTKSC